MRAAGQSVPALAAVVQASDELNQILWTHPAIEGVCASDRLVYLGSNTLFGAAREAALKALEMTAGKVVTLAESSLGFRHGPKSIVNENTTVTITALVLDRNWGIADENRVRISITDQ